MQVNMPAARRLAQLPENYADGGAVGFGARGLSQLRELVPKMAAMGFPQQAQAPAPAPVSDPRAAQLMAMIPQMEAMGFKQKPQMLARGGMVRGPGTGTSDSIPDQAEPGTYIMPADSTAAIGPSALEKMGTVPVRLSDGEMKLPPEQVMAIGEAVLKLMKDATHTPVNGEDGGQTDEKVGEGAGHKQAEAASGGTEDDAEGMGFSPAQRMAQMPPAMYADGGMVDNNVTRVRTKYSVGDRVQVKPGKGHDTTTKDKQGTIVKITTPALGVKFDGMTMVHKWYTDDEVTDAQGLKAAKQMAKMPEQLYADGGMVDPNRPNSFGDAAAVTRDPGVTQVDSGYQPGNGTVSVVPSQPVAPPAPTRPPNTVVSMINPEWDRVAKQQNAAAPAPQNAAAALTAPPAPAAAPTAPTPAPQPAAAMGWLDRNKQRNAEVSAASIANRPEWSKSQGVPAPALPPEPPPPAPPPVDSRISMPPSTFQSRAAYGYQPRRYADGGMVEDDLQKRLMQIPSSAPPGWSGNIPTSAPPGWNGGGGGSGGGGGAGGVTGSWEAPQAAPAPAQPAGALTRAASMSAPPSQAPAVQAMATLPLNPNGGQISTRSMGAADGLARRGAADALAQMPNAPAPVQAPTVLTSENSWQKRNDLRNALVSASSITANGGRFDRNKGESPESLTYRAMLGTDQALQASAPGLAQAAMREQGDTQRAGLQVSATTAEGAANRQNDLMRTLVTERGNNTRTGISALAATEAARLKAQQEGKAPPGYRFTANGNMEAIPGGPADLRQNKEGVQQGKDTQDIFSILNEARPLMENATGSYGGVALDKAAQTFGVATDGAKATAQLQALQGALVSKMPKMSGPQSDKDVQLYREMAGQIGDPTIPREQRKAAMDTIESLNIKYLPAVTDAAGYDAVPSGSYYKTPSGDVRRKQ